MRGPALACLPAALLATFIGVLAPAHTARAASPAFAVQDDQISLRRPGASQFMDGAAGEPAGLDRPARPATTSDSIRVGPGNDQPTTIVYGSDPDTDRAVSTALTCALYVAGVVAIFALAYAFGNIFHSATPLDQGAGR